MKRYVSLFLLALMLCAVLSVGCGGGSDSTDSEQTESINNDTDSYEPNDESRGMSGAPVDLSKITAAYTAKDGQILTGKLGRQVKISVADGATVTLRDVTIEGKNLATCLWAGLTCEGDAALIIDGTNTVKGFYCAFPAIYVPENKTLTITGTGTLTADASASFAAGIGGGQWLPCGNIVIEGGTIIAKGGELFAGTGAGIGSGYGSSCGNITLKDTATKVTATRGKHAKHSVGAGYEGSCGTITIGGVVKAPIERSPYNYKDIIDLSTLTAAYTAQDSDTLTGRLSADVKISVAHGAAVTLKDVTINGENSISTPWAGLTCSGDATLIIEGSNYVQRAHRDYPAIYVPEGYTLTITGSGELTADASGGSYESYSAGIGGCYSRSCGNIVIEGGTIIAKGGWCSAGIGGGYQSNCGNIMIKDTITEVTATNGWGAKHNIGAGQNGTCGTVKVGWKVDPIEQSPYTYKGSIDLSTITAAYTAQDNETLTGKIGGLHKISVADGATIILRDVNIEGKNLESTRWAGLTCEGDATLILEGSNYVQRAHRDYPAIYVPEGHTLTINGIGKLTADASDSYSAGIGGAKWVGCGNIVIDGGIIEAIGGEYSAGIGGGYDTPCGNITIARGKVTATKGSNAPYSVGAGSDSTCGTVTIRGVVTGSIEQSPYNYENSIIDLSKVTTACTAQDGETITGTLDANVKIYIADGATVTLRDATLNGVNNDSFKWAGINCVGDATIILEGTNSIKGFHRHYPAVYVPVGHTLTIKGSGELIADATDSFAPGIGGGFRISCGNIVIDGGTIIAKGGERGSGSGAGIGGGYEGSCGDITITKNVTKVIAIKGNGAPYSIGAGYQKTCGTITIGGVVTGKIEQSTYTYPSDK